MFQKYEGVPLHVQVADFARDKIYSREWGVNEPIPSEHELMDMLHLSRGTVQKGIRALVDEGLLVQQRGRGTFVVKPVVTNPSGNRLLSFAESMKARGVEYTTKVVAKRTEPAKEACAHALGIDKGDRYFYLARLRSVQGKPVMLIESHLNLQQVPGIDKIDFEHQPLFAAVEQSTGHSIGRSDQVYCACVAGKMRSHWLECDEKAPVLNTEQWVTLDNGHVFEWDLVWMPANRCQISVRTNRMH